MFFNSFSKIKPVLVLLLVILAAGCNSKKTSDSVSKDSEIAIPKEQNAFVPADLTNHKKKNYKPKITIRKNIPEELASVDSSGFTTRIPEEFYAAGTYIVPNDDVFVSTYTIAKADEKFRCGSFSAGQVAVIKNVHKYEIENELNDFVWFQICILNTGDEGWVKADKERKDFKYSCNPGDFEKDSYSFNSINASISVNKKRGKVEHWSGNRRRFDSIAFSPNGDEFLVNAGSTLYIYDIGASSEKAVIESYGDVTITKKAECCYSDNGKNIYIVTEDGSICSYSTENETIEKISKFEFDKGYYYYPWKVSVSPDERFIFTKSSVRWNSREDALVFVYDRKLQKQYVFDLRSRSRPEDVCGDISDFVFKGTNDVYVSAGSYGYGNSIFVHFYLNAEDELVYEQQEEGMNLVAAVPGEEAFVVYDECDGFFSKRSMTGDVIENKYPLFLSQEYSFPHLECINSEGTLAAIDYHTESDDENIALYSLSSMNLLGVINVKNGIAGFSNNTLLVFDSEKSDYVAYELNVTENENQLDLSTPYSEELNELCGNECTTYTFYLKEERVESMREGPGGYCDLLKVKFYPNGFYGIESEECIEDSWKLASIYGPYEINFPYLKIYSPTVKQHGVYNEVFKPEYFYGLPIVDDDDAFVYMMYDNNKDYEYKIKCTFSNLSKTRLTDIPSSVQESFENKSEDDESDKNNNLTSNGYETECFPESKIMWVKTDDGSKLNVRQAPVNGGKKGQFEYGAKLEVTKRTKEEFSVDGISAPWYYAESTGSASSVKGWVFGGYLTEKNAN